MARIWLSFCSNLIPGGIGFVTVPFGPVTTTLRSLISTFTLSGTGMGFFPIRDIDASSINVAEQLAAETLPASMLASHDAVRRRQNVDAQAAEHFRNFGLRNVHAATGPADAFDVRNHRLAFRTVLQEQSQQAFAAFFARFVMNDVTLFLQNPGGFNLQSRSRHVDLLVPGLNRIPD